MKNSPVDCFSRGEVLAGCGSPVETSAAGRSTDRADRRDLPLLSVRINLHPAEQAGKTHQLGDNQRLKILIVMLCLSCFRLFCLFEFHGFRTNIFCPEYSHLCVFPMLFPPVTDVDYDKILDKRRRTIPTNGLRINFSDGFLREILFKEIYKSDQVILLYKLTTKYGELSGAYRTKSKVFFSAFYQTEEKEGKLLHDTIRNLILWFYAAYTCDVEGISLTMESYRKHFADIASELTFTQMGGKLKRVDSGAVVNHKIAGKDGYDTRIKNISGYIRKLPTGQALNETFVAPFQRAAWYKLKRECQEA